MATFRIIRDLTEYMRTDVCACVADVPNIDGTHCYFVAWGRPAELIWAGLRPYLFGDPDEQGQAGDADNGYVIFGDSEEAALAYADDMTEAIKVTRGGE